ncbi:MAG TPA: TonB-dependent receptor [Planctomycetota bacterium]
MLSDPTLWIAALLASGAGEEETLVTARKQSEALADVPLAVSALDGRELELERLLTVHDAVARVPNVFVSEFTSRRLSFPFVRGIGSGLGDPAVITYVDDVPQFGFGGTNLPLVGVESLELLRGPQGTLYGKNALGGLIHVRGRRPAAEPRFDVGVGAGSHDLRELSGGFSGPLTPSLAADLALFTSERDGFSDNRFSGNDVDDRHGSFGRGRLLYAPSASSELDFSLFGERARDGGFALNFLEDVPAFGITGLRNESHQIDQDFEGKAERDVYSPALVWRVLGDQHDFTSVSAYQSWDALELSDFDFTPVDGVRRTARERQDYLYQELRFGTGADVARGPLRWQVGASGSLSERESSAANELRPGGAGIFFPPGSEGTDASSGDFDDTGWAAFGQVSVPVGAFDLEGGLRYDRERREASTLHTFDPGIGPIVLGAVDEAETFDELLPMASLSWHAREDALVYLRAAKGFKAGGFNLSAPSGSESFEAETAWTYELGWKQTFDERHTLAAALFHVDWDDRQVSLFDPMAGGYVANAGEAESQGLELEGETRLLGDAPHGLFARAAFGLADTEIDATGEDLPQAPETTWTLGLRYEHALDGAARWYVRTDYQNVGDFSYDTSNLAGDSYDLVNAGLGLVRGRLGLDLWIQNAFDEEYVPTAFQANPSDPNSFVGESGAPRVLGFTLSAHL